MKTRFYIKTLGCAKNRVDSEIMLGTLLQHDYEYVEEPQDAEVIIINTCGFLTSAVNESIETILGLAELKETGSCKKLVVAGCMVERYRENILDEIPEIDAILGTSDFTEIFSCIQGALDEDDRRSWLAEKPDYAAANNEASRVLSTERHYAYLKVSEGCSNMCSFCNIPKLRGNFRSRPIPHILNEFKQFLKWNIKEINMISQDSSSYGFDLPKEHNLLQLTEQILRSSDEDFWLRIFYSYPNRYPLELVELMKKDSRLVKYMDMPFQHVSDAVLKDMNRKISKDRILEILDQSLEQLPELAVRTTFITGFPTETEKNFQELLELIQQGYFEHVGVFTYSHEDNIHSARFGDPIPQEVKDERRKILMEAQQEVQYRKNKEKIGTTMRVLIEGLSDETDLLLQGRSQFQGVDVDGVVLINEGEANQGEFRDVEITEAHPYDLVGRIL